MEMENLALTATQDAQAKQIAGLLDTRAQDLTMRTLTQLEIGRERAVKAHAQKITGINVNSDGTLSYLSGWAENHRMASVGMLLGVLLLATLLMQPTQHHEASDAFLLGADLPPEAFVDKGFEPSLNGQYKS